MFTISGWSISVPQSTPLRFGVFVTTGDNIYKTCIYPHLKHQPNYWITRMEHPDVAPLPQCDMEHSFTVNAKYADDFTYASTSECEINRTKATVLEQLDVYNLNEKNPEEYTVPDAKPIKGNGS